MGHDLHPAPTARGASNGVDNGTPWAFEPADEHWRRHDEREVAYWRSRRPEERLAQALRYRMRVHGAFSAPTSWSWRFVPFDE